MASEEVLAGLGPGRRLHPLSWLFLIGSTAKSLVIPALLLIFASQGFGFELWALLLLVPATVGALAKMFVFRYWYAPHDLVIRDGLLTRNERHVPYGRIQNVDLVRNPFHRLLGVAQVRIETASGSEPEAVIRVLSMEAVEEMRAHVFAEKRQAAGTAAGVAPPPARALFNMPTREVVKYGLIDNRGMVVVAAALGLVWQLGIFDEGRPFALDFDDLPAWLRVAVREDDWFGIREGHWLAPLLTGALLLLTALLLLRLLSVVLALITLHRFTLTRDGEDLRTEMGLFTRLTATIPRPRVQLLTVESGWLARRFGRVSVQVETAGSAPAAGEDADTQGPQIRWLAPLLPRDQVAPLLAEVLPEVPYEELDWQPLAPRAWRRILKRWLFWVAVLTVPVALLAGWWALAFAVPAALWGWLHARRWVRHTGWATTGQAVAYRSGWWKQKLSIVRYGKIQTVELRANPFDRRNDMARLSVDTAGARRAGHRVHVPYLATATARELSERLYFEAAETAFRW